MGNKETKELIMFGVALGNGLGKTFEDGKFKLMELTNFIPALIKLPAGLEGIGSVDDELKNMTPAERLDLVNEVAEQLDLPGDRAEAMIEDGFALGMAVWGYIQKHFLANADG